MAGDPNEEITLDKELIIDKVVFKRREEIIDIPKINYKVTNEETTKYIRRDEPTTKYVKREEETTQYIPRNEETTRYISRDVECERPIPIDREYERPVIKEVTYEKPKLVEKVVEVIVVKNLDEVKSCISLVKELNEQLGKLSTHLSTLREYKLVEELVRVPRIEYKPVYVERIVWTDVIRERI